ncbi:M48 family metallopeptidase [Vampirovibrio chlorellavorus]|uniref:M48 family metallopeptidase n=1 Tax=Vampirovibrio chlorellavorus TaxID=758823 RepID=UPI0026F2CDDB|nr:M48 family metallopeptidase [Vampirovibrio chlorellavorus]
MSVDSMGAYLPMVPVVIDPPFVPPAVPQGPPVIHSFRLAEPMLLPDEFIATRPVPTAHSPNRQCASKIDEWMLRRSKPLYMPEATLPLTRMARQIAARNGIPKPHKILIVNKPFYNAAAYGNGTVVFHLDALKQAKSPEELAFVLAHELSHVQFEDVKAKKVRHGIAVGVALLADELAAWVFRVRSLVKSLGISLLVPIGSFQWAAFMERKDEARADTNAIRLLAKAGFGTDGYLSAFENMAHNKSKAQWWRQLEWKIYGENHPSLSKRVQAISQTVRQQPPLLEPQPVMSPAEWQRLKAAAAQVGTADS